MPEFQATPSQAAAIQSRGAAVLVSAGAGSGKTQVLTRRLLARICDETEGVDLDRFLISTFTRAAAGELKSRIAEELDKALAADPGNRRLRRQSALCRKAQIGTIHSFCTTLLRENCQALSLSPDFKILDEERAGHMKAAALQQCLETWYEQPETHSGFLQLADTAGAGRDDRRLGELVLLLHGKMQSHARPELWAAEQAALLQTDWSDAGETPWGKEILSWAAALGRYWSGELDKLLAALQSTQKLRGFYEPRLGPCADALRELARCAALGWDRAAASCRAIPRPNFQGARNAEDPALAARIKTRRDAMQKSLEKLGQVLCDDSRTLLADLRQVAGPMSALLALTLDFDARYAADKRRAALVDYADLEHMAARLLTEADGSPTALARQVSARYDEIMVDEYQDVSPVQEQIFRAISRAETNRFLVGDVKQSIYRFRLAEPGIFADKYEHWPLYTEAAPGQARKILLRENFRSRREILDAANCVFSRCMSRELGDVDYDEQAALICGTSYDEGGGCVPELLLLNTASEDDDAPDRLEAEAVFVAEKIRELVESGISVQRKDGPGPVGYGDIAILMSAANSVGPVYRRVLSACGVPVAAGQGVGYFRRPEISTTLSLLAVLDNPHQDVPLIAVLRSAPFGFTADELSAIRAAAPKTDFITALRRAAESDLKCADFLARLDRLRHSCAERAAEDLIWLLLDELDLLAVFSAMSDGEQRRANLLELTELARRFEGSGYRGLHRFVLWLRRLAARGEEPAVGAPGGAVQIYTIHKSKGLEFPVVFLTDTARRFNVNSLNETVLIHPALGLGPKVTDLERRVEYPSLARLAIRRRLEREMLSEQMRLLYVAMTRARERLYITAALNKPAQAMEKLSLAAAGGLSSELLAEQSCFASWLILAAQADGERHLRLRLVENRAAPETPPERDAPACEPDAAAMEELRRNLDFRYPHGAAQDLPSKLTATELKGREEADPDAAPLSKPRGSVFRLPDFSRKNRPLSGAQRGTATHLVLQYMDFAAGDRPESVRAEIERLRQKQLLSDREAEAVDVGSIVRLFASPLGQRMRAAKSPVREFKFSLLCDAGALCEGGAGEEVLLQGVVDCCIEENGALTIIDYKTDAVRGEAALQSRAAYYAGQLRAYAAALRRIFQKPVRECVLVFLSTGATVSLPVEDPEIS